MSLTGVACGAGAFFLWGVLPLYWNLTRSVPATEVLAHRIFWSLSFVLLVVYLRGQQHALYAALRNPRLVAISALSATIIGLNWWLFIWAVNNGYVLQSSLGYFINPLMNVVIGVVLLHEHLPLSRKIAITLAAIGCLIIAFASGEVPLIALFLALSFAVYGYLRKMSPLGSITGLAMETLLLSPLALAYLVYLNADSRLVFAHLDTFTDVVLCSAGIVTAIPLLLFAESARRMPLSALGLLQYLSPTGHFLLAVFYFHETFGFSHLMGFVCIWLGLAVFSVDLIRQSRQATKILASR